MSQLDHDFDEALISGYLDGELAQGEAQRVQVHLQDCPTCQALYDELARMKEATMSTQFHVPDDGWDETPRTALSRLLRNVGLALGALVLMGAAVWLVWELAQDPQALMALLVTGGLLISGALLLASVIIDRRAAMKNDKYRRIQR